MSRTHKNERRMFFKRCKQMPLLAQKKSIRCKHRTNAARGIYEVEPRDCIYFD